MMHPPRFRVRTLMVAVAAIAVGLGSLFWLSKRRDEFLKLAAQHSSEAGRLEWELVAKEQGWGDRGSDARARAFDAIHWNGRMAAKYTHAANRPWLSVPLDPPPPQPPSERMTSHP
jgi:hypothetical protein